MSAVLMRACVLPAAAMALLGAATVGFLEVVPPAADTGSTMTTRVVLAGAAIGALLILAGAYAGARAGARQVHDQHVYLRSLHARVLDELRYLIERTKRGERSEPPGAAVPPAGTTDPSELLAYDVLRVQFAAQRAVFEAASLTPDPDQRVEVFVNLAWRMQSLVHREIQLLDELEAQVEDPDLLKGLFTVDHLATLLRRQTESLAVLGGAASRRRWSSPVTMYDVLRSAVAEVEQYSRVKLVLPIDGVLHGDAVAHIIHLVAELVENATKFSPPETQVLIRAENVTAGLAIEVEDRGLGIPSADRHRMNDVLADPSRVNIGELLRDGRIGLFVVSALARRHGVRVELHTNVYGGTQAVMVLPRELVDPAAQDRQHRGDRSDQLVAAAVPPGPPAPLAPPASPKPPTSPTSSGPPTPAPASVPASVPAPVPAPAAPTPAAAAPAPRVQAAASSVVSAATVPIFTPNSIDVGAERPTAPAATSARGSRDDGVQRPPLPQRRVQQSLAPELRETPTRRHDEPTAEHTPSLMADFLRGVSRSDEESHQPDGPGGLGTG